MADTIRARRCGETVTYVINRNINYTNHVLLPLRLLRLLARAQEHEPARRPLLLNVHEVVHRSVEAWERGATEVCLQGGIHPDFTGDFYVSVLEAIKERLPEMHVHGFTPLEVWQGAHTLGIRCASSWPACATPASAPFRARPPRSSTTRCATTCAPTRCAPPSGPR